MRPIRVERIIEAPPAKIFEIILDIDRYPEWNSFTPRIGLATRDVTVGAEFDLDCQMTETQLLRGEREVVLEIDHEKRHFCMGTSRKRGRPGIRSFRWQKCDPGPDGGTHFINYEYFEGPLGAVVYFLYRKRLARAFERFCDDLERRATTRA